MRVSPWTSRSRSKRSSGPPRARGPRRSSCFPRSKTTTWRIPSSELLWRGALGGGSGPTSASRAQGCALISRNGRCSSPLDAAGVHVNNCKCAGHVVRRHDRLVRWLAAWLGDRVESEVLVEQLVGTDQSEERLDITFDVAGRRLWIDVAVVSPLTNSLPHRARRSRIDGAAARDEETHKRSKYAGLATPFVVETMGRPGDSARGVLGAFAVDNGAGTVRRRVGRLASHLGHRPGRVGCPGAQGQRLDPGQLGISHLPRIGLRALPGITKATTSGPCANGRGTLAPPRRRRAGIRLLANGRSGARRRRPPPPAASPPSQPATLGLEPPAQV